MTLEVKKYFFILDKPENMDTLTIVRVNKKPKRLIVIIGGIQMAKKKTTKKAAKTTKKAATKKAAKTTKKAGGKRKPNAAFMKPLTPSNTLAAVIGASPMPRTEVVKKLWAYIRKHGLQDSQNRRNINADDKLKPIFGKNTVSMFEMTKLVSKHLK